ncbi:MAG: hypothetical protein WBB28_22770 [Crinalium sp.]
MSRTSVTIPEPLLEWFQDYCKKQRRSVSAQISFMVEQLKEQETQQNEPRTL